MSQQLQIYDRELRAFHVALAHELRSRLTAAIGRLQGIRNGVFEREPHQLNMIMKQLHHMSRLIDELYLLSLAEAGQLRRFSRLVLALMMPPFGLPGIVLAMLPAGIPMEFVSLFGIIALAGMIIRNAVILITEADANLEAGHERDLAVM